MYLRGHGVIRRLKFSERFLLREKLFRYVGLLMKRGLREKLAGD